MTKTNFREFSIDNASILFLSLVRPFHTNSFRFSAVLTALVGEYLRITQSGIVNPVPLGYPQENETVDSFRDLADTPPKRLPSRFSYLLPRPQDADWQVRGNALTLSTAPLLAAARRHGVTVNTLLTAVMASSVMEMQVKQKGEARLQPVRLMVPINLRKMTGSRTLRNFSLYALPTMEPEHHRLPLTELCRIMATQLKEQLSPDNQAAMVFSNVRSQDLWFYKALPLALKRIVLRIGYRFFGDSNSSLTLTNLGIVRLPEEIAPHVADFQCRMTPRVTSPYGCTVLSFGEHTTLNMSRFCPRDELGEVFFRNLQAAIKA